MFSQSADPYCPDPVVSFLGVTDACGYQRLDVRRDDATVGLVTH